MCAFVVFSRHISVAISTKDAVTVMLGRFTVHKVYCVSNDVCNGSLKCINSSFMDISLFW